MLSILRVGCTYNIWKNKCVRFQNILHFNILNILYGVPFFLYYNIISFYRNAGIQ